MIKLFLIISQFNRLKEEKYKGNVGDKFVIVHREAGKGASNSKVFYIKEKYETPKVDHIKREDKDHLNKFKITILDSESLSPSPIQNKISKLKLQYNGKEISYDINMENKKSENGFTTSKEAILFQIPNDIANGTVFKFTQVGDNFSDSKALEYVYKIDTSYAEKLLKEFNDYPENKKTKGNKELAKVIESEMKGNITQELLDTKCNNFETAVLHALRDKLVEIRKKAIDDIGKLNNLSTTKKSGYIAQITGAQSKKEIEEILQIAKDENVKENNKKIEEELRQEKQNAISKIKVLENLNEEEIDKATERINAAKKKEDIEPILIEYTKLNGDREKLKEKEKSERAEIESAKKNLLAKIETLIDLKEEEKKDFIASANNAKSIEEVRDIEKRAELADKTNKRAKEDLKKRKDEALLEIKQFEEITQTEKADAETKIKNITKVEDVEEVLNEYKKLNQDRLANKHSLEGAKINAYEMITKLKNLESKYVENANDEISGVNKIEDIFPIIEKYTRINNDKELEKQENEMATNFDRQKLSILIEEAELLFRKIQPKAQAKLSEAVLFAREALSLDDIEKVEIASKKLEQAIVDVQSEKGDIDKPDNSPNEELNKILKLVRENANGQIDNLKNLAEFEKDNAKEEIRIAKSIKEIEEIVNKYTKIGNDRETEKKQKELELKEAKEKLQSLINEAKALSEKLSQSPKALLETKIKEAENKLMGNNILDINGASLDLIRVIKEAKDELDKSNSQKENEKEIDGANLMPSFKKYENRKNQRNSNSKDKTNKVFAKVNKRESSHKYTDISKHWAKDAIEFCLENKLFEDIVSADEFNPSKEMTRAEFVTVLGRYERAESFVTNIPFKDVDMNAYYAKYINWAKNLGLIYGVDDVNFAPNKTITREEIATILYRYKKLKKIEFNGEEKIFKDEIKIANWAKEAVRELSKSKIINGTEEGNFNAKKNLTRAEIAQIIYNVNKIK